MIIGELKNYGFREEDVKIEPKDYILGSALPLISIKEDGQYDNFLPQYEPQILPGQEDTYGCTIWGSQNQEEIYHKLVFGFEPNYSERYNYNCVGINPPGANPNNAYQSFRHDGLVDQSVLPVVETLEAFSKPRPMEQKYLDIGKKWLEEYDIQHEWVTGQDIKSAIINSLKFSPIALSVTAWFFDGEYYVDNGMPNTHWCVCYGYKETPLGLALKIYDSYDHSTKLLHPNHRIAFAKRIYITKKPQQVKKKTIFQVFLEKFKEFWDYWLNEIFYKSLLKVKNVV